VDLKHNEAGGRPKVSPPQKLVEERDFWTVTVAEIHSVRPSLSNWQFEIGRLFSVSVTIPDGI